MGVSWLIKRDQSSRSFNLRVANVKQFHVRRAFLRPNQMPTPVRMFAIKPITPHVVSEIEREMFSPHKIVPKLVPGYRGHFFPKQPNCFCFIFRRTA